MGWIGYEGILKVGYRYSADIVQIQCTYSTDTDSTDSADAVQMQYRFIHRCIHRYFIRYLSCRAQLEHA